MAPHQTPGFRLMAVLLLAALRLPAQGTITTVAGTEWVFAGDGKSAISAPLGPVASVALDPRGNLVFSDPGNNIVVRVNPSGVITVLAGNGLTGYSGDGGAAVNAALDYPEGVAFDSKGNLYIADSGNNRIRRVTPDGVITTFAGNGHPDYTGDTGLAVNAALSSPIALAIDASDTVFICDVSNNVIRRVTADGIISTWAGNGKIGFSGEGGPATQAALDDVEDIAVDRAGNLYLVDRGNNIVRKVDAKGIITTVAGNRQAGYSGDGAAAVRASLNGPGGIAVDNANNLYISDTNNIVIRKVDSQGIITTIAGSGSAGYSGDGGSARGATFRALFGLAVDAAGNIFVADRDNSRIREVSANAIVSTVAGNGAFRVFGDGTPAANAFLFQPFGISLDAKGNLYVADTFNNRIRMIAPGGATSTIAGNGGSEFSGDRGFATAAGLSGPTSVTPDNNGNLYIADTDNYRIRKVSANGTITTVLGDGTPATLKGPQQVAIDKSGNLYISDAGNNRIRKVATDGTVSTFGPGGLIEPLGIAFDTAGNLYVADWGNGRIRKVSPDGSSITTVAGGGTRAVTAGSSFPATQAQLGHTLGVALDSAGSLYFSDGTYRIFKVSPAGDITLVAGSGNVGFSGDGGPSTQAAFNFPYGLAIDPAGNILIADAVNNRVRSVLSTPVTLQSSPGSLTFSAKSGGGLTDAQNISIASSVSGLLYSLSAPTATGGNWLKANLTGGSTPGTVQVLADPTGLDAGVYQGSVAIAMAGSSRANATVTVSFTVTPHDDPKLGIGVQALTFATVQGAAPSSQSLSVLNQGGGSLSFSAAVSTDSGGNWLSVTPATGAAAPVLPAALAVQADPTGLDPGTYTGAVSITSDSGAAVSARVILTVSAVSRKLQLSQTGLKFTAVSDGGTPLPQDFAVLNAGQGDLAWTVQSTTLGGGNGWLTVNPASGSSTAGASTIPLVTVSVNVSSLDPGEYYGRIQVFSPSADNSPQTVSVVVDVLPAGSDPGPEVRPTGLIFTGPAGSSPGSQNVFVSNLTTAPISYSSSRSTTDGQTWFLNAPTNSAVSPNQPVRVVVQPDFTQLSAGTYTATLQLAFAGGVTRSVNIVALVGGGGATAASRPGSFHPEAITAASCNDRLIVTLITPPANFSLVATQPAPVQASVRDSCNSPVNAGIVKARFANGDPDLPLVSKGNGVWEGTWQPRSATPPQVNMDVEAALVQSNGTRVLGQTSVVSGTLRAGGVTPVVSAAVVNAASFVVQPLVAPGGLITIFGQQMADTQTPGSCAPTANATLVTQLGGAQVFLDNTSLALLYACDGQINAQVPYDMAVNTSHQLWMQRSSAQAAAQSIPVDLSVASTQPAIFTVSQNGLGQGDIFKVLADGSQSSAPADPSAPVTAGDAVVIICSGLGGVSPKVALGDAGPTPAAKVVSPVSISIGGQPAQVSAAVLAPNSFGVYQVTAVVPAGVTPGDQVAVTVAIGGQTSPPVTMAVR